MKKSFLILLSSILAVFLITGCADSSSNNNSGTGTGGTGGYTGEPLTEELINQLQGTYTVTFFGSQVTNVRSDNPFFANTASMYYVSNDCAKAKELYPDIIGANGMNNCESPSTLLDGQVVIKITNGEMVITSRMQMEGIALDLSPADKYQYTTYNKTTTTAGLGVSGYNYDATNNKPSASATNFPNSPFKVTLNTDGTVRIDMTLKDKSVSAVGMQGTVDAVNTILLTKDSADTTDLENAIQQNFTQSASQTN